MTEHQRWPAAPGCVRGVDMLRGHGGLWRFDWERDDQTGVGFKYDTVTALFAGGEVGLTVLDCAPIGDAVWWWPSNTPPAARDIQLSFQSTADKVYAEALYVPTGAIYGGYGPDQPAAAIEVLNAMHALDAIERLNPVEVVR